MRCSLPILIAFVTLGCSTEFDPDAPAAGEKHRKALMEKGDYGAATIEDLRKIYLKAHRDKDMDQFRHMLGFNVGRLNSNHQFPWHGLGSGNPVEKWMTKLFEIPIKDVEFVKGPDSKSKYYGFGATFYRERDGKQKQGTTISGDVYGKLILVAEDGRRIDPFYPVLDYYGRFVVSSEPHVQEDAYDSYQKKRPPIWLPLPMDPSTDKEKALFKEILKY